MGRHNHPRPVDSQRAHQPSGHIGYGHKNDDRYESYEKQCFKPPTPRPLELNNANLLSPSLEPRARQDNVWRWLSQTTARETHHRRSEGRDQERVYNRHISDSRRASECSEDSPWNPHENPTAAKGTLLALPVSSSHQRKPRRRRPQSTDSSIISGLRISAESPRKRYRSASVREHNATSEYSSHLHQDLPPSASSLDQPSRFEKKPRRKTREDKYESKKCKRSQTKNDSSKPRRKSDKKKRVIGSGKHLMNNFTSDAVLNDRITVSTFSSLRLDGSAYTPAGSATTKARSV